MNTYIPTYFQTQYNTRFQQIRNFTSPIFSIFHFQFNKKTIDN